MYFLVPCLVLSTLKLRLTQDFHKLNNEKGQEQNGFSSGRGTLVRVELAWVDVSSLSCWEGFALFTLKHLLCAELDESENKQGNHGIKSF